MASPTGKSLHELQSLGLLEIADKDLVLIGDISEPLISKATTVNALRVTIGSVIQSDNTINEDLESPTWVVEGERGHWKISVLSAVEDAAGYYLWYYNEDVDAWVLYPKSITETRSLLGMASGALVLNVYVVRDDDGIAPRTYRRFKIQTITATEQSPFSDEQSAYSIVSLPATFVPTAPTLVDDDDYPYTAALANYGQYSHSVILRANAATGEADYIERYELQRRPYVLDQPDKAGWVTLPMHTLILDPQKPAPSRLIYTDDSSKAAPGDVLEYRVRAVAVTGDSNETPSAWSDVVTYTVENDDTAPDPPVLTVHEVPLGFEIIFDEPTQNEGDPCYDFWYHKLFYSTNAGVDWDSVMDPKDDGKDRRFEDHKFEIRIKDADLDLDYIFRAKTWDWSGNSSDFCDATSPTNPDKLSDAVMNASWTQRFTDVEDGVSSHTTLISQNAEEIVLRATKAYVDGEVILGAITVNAGAIALRATKAYVDGSTILGAITVNATNIGLRVQWNGGATTLKLSQDGVYIKGTLLKIDGDVLITGDAMIQGTLVTAGGIKTGGGTSRMEFGQYGVNGNGALIGYISDEVRLDIHILGSGIPRMRLGKDNYYCNIFNNKIELLIGASPKCVIDTGGLIIDGSYVLTGQMTIQTTLEGVITQLKNVGLMATS